MPNVSEPGTTTRSKQHRDQAKNLRLRLSGRFCTNLTDGPIRASDLAFLSPYATSKLKRFGDYPTDLKPEAMPARTTLPL